MDAAEPLSTADPLCDWATRHAAASRVFYELGLDYCCGGRRPLAEACREKDLDPEAVRARILQEDSSAGEWAPSPDASPTELVDHIQKRYHERLRAELPELVRMAEKVEKVHADKPLCPKGLAAHLRVVHAAVLDHLEKEEGILFPAIRSGAGSEVAGPIQVMEFEHVEHKENLQRLRGLAHDFALPEDACSTWRALYLRLREFESDLFEHIHLENNVLFPKVLSS